ncbi:MAG TPA: PAS domain S-box protein, partial [Flavisolibacter sp.]|nr:PAS domain S-box protein [Flavisolibacter sp.]
MNFNQTTRLIIGLLILGAIYFFTSTYYNNQRTTITFQRVSHTYQVIEEIDNLNTSIVDLESEVRGYIISGNSVFLRGLSEKSEGAKRQLGRLQELTSDNPTQQAYIKTLSDLVEAKLAFQQELLVAYKKSNQKALAMIASLRGKAITDTFKSVLAKMHKEEQRLLQLRIAANQNINRRMFYSSLVIGIIGFVLLIIALWKINKEYKRRKVAEQLSKANEEKYKGLINNSGVGIYTSDVKGRFQFVNYQCTEITGYKSQELLGKHFSELVVPEKRKEVETFYVHQYTAEIKETLLQFPIHTKEGFVKWVEQSAVLLMEHGVVVGFQCIVKDITENKLGEDLLRDAELRLRAEQEENQFRLQAIIDNIPMVVYIKDLEGRFIMVNKRFREELNMTDEMILGRTNKDVNTNELQAENYIASDREVVETLRPVELEEVVVTGTGERYMLVTKFPLFDKNNQLFAISGVDKDITDMVHFRQRLIEAKLRAEKAEKLQEEFLANMSHEIRTPMNGIIGMTNLLSETALNKDQMEFVQIIKQSSDTLLMLINDILDLSKIKSGRMTVEAIDFSVQEVIDAIVAPLQIQAREKQVFVRKSLHQDIPAIISGDQFKLAQVLNNLLSNAVKFTERGEIKVVVNKVSEKDETITLEFIVSDTGIGIGAEHLDYIFESFAQAGNDMIRRYGGTGLGLAITKRLIELQGGTIQVSSTVGIGTTFCFVMTYQKAAQSGMLPASNLYVSKESKCLSGKKILLVEDNEINQKVTSLILQKKGLFIDIANNGKEAVEMLEGGKKYDLIIMDLQMPEMNGFQTTIYIRQKLSIQTPIIAMTASALRNERVKCFEIGMNEYMTKPFVPAELFKQLERLLKVGDKEGGGSEAEVVNKLVDSPYSLAYLEEVDDQEYLVEVLQLFLDTTPDALNAIREQVIYENWEEVYRIAHKLKSSLGILQMSKMLADITEIEMLAKETRELDRLPILISGALIHYNLI